MQIKEKIYIYSNNITRTTYFISKFTPPTTEKNWIEIIHVLVKQVFYVINIYFLKLFLHRG